MRSSALRLGRRWDDGLDRRQEKNRKTTIARLSNGTIISFLTVTQDHCGEFSAPLLYILLSCSTLLITEQNMLFSLNPLHFKFKHWKRRTLVTWKWICKTLSGSLGDNEWERKRTVWVTADTHDILDLTLASSESKSLCISLRRQPVTWSGKEVTDHWV